MHGRLAQYFELRAGLEQAGMCGPPTSRHRGTILVVRGPCVLMVEVDVVVTRSANRLGNDLTWFLTIARGFF
jgi:hypothetical protein